MKYISIFLVAVAINLSLNLNAQFTKEYKFDSDSVQVFELPSTVNGYYLPPNISGLNKPLYAEPFATNVSFPTLAQDIYPDAGNFANTIFGGDEPGVLGFGFTSTTTIINETYSTHDFPIILEADFFNRSSFGNYNESYFWLGNSNYTNFNPSNSILPTADVQQGIIIGGLPERSIISHARNFLLPSIALINTTHNFASYNQWYKLKVILDVTEDGRLVIYSIFVDDNCVMSDPIIVEKFDDLNLNSFKLAICVDDFAKEFKVTKNARLFELPDVVVCENGSISFSSDFEQDLCIDFNYLWDLPGSDVGSSTINNPSNINYSTSGKFESSLTFSNGNFSRIIPFKVEVESSFAQIITRQLCPNDSIFFNYQWLSQPGIYEEVLTLASGCDSITTLDLTFSDSIKTSLDFLICIGDTIKVGLEIYTTQGNFVQNLTSALGCDSTLFITIGLINEDLIYDFNKCSAIVGSTNMDYSEFTSTFSQISCGTIALSNIFRSNPIENKHSCTPGLGNSLAMCVESSSDCAYSDGNDKSVVFTFEVTPEEGKHFQIAKLKFFEKSPLMYDWINGASGVNNYATKFGFRVLKNGVEIYKDEEIISSRDWKEHKIAFMNNEDFIAKEKSTYQFEFLPYCPIGNSSPVSVWDLENISIFTSCLDKENRVLAGAVADAEGNPLVNVNVLKQQQLEIENIMTDENGNFAMSDVVNSDDCEISVLKNEDFLNGVTTLDLILIQRHILGLDIFDQSRKYVAADVNNDTRVSAADLVELRKLILGVTSKFSHNKSWRFITELPDFDRHSIIDVNEKYAIEKGVKDLTALNFTGIKLGDVNNDSNLKANQEFRSNNVEEIKVEIKKIGNGEQIVNFFTTSSFDLSGLQMSLIVEGIYDFKVQNNQINIGQDDIYNNGKNINISFSSANSVSVNDFEPLFSLILKGIDNNKNIFKGLNNDFGNELYYSDLSFKNISIISLDNSEAFISVNAKPNPFSDQTLVEYYNDESGPVSIEIYNVTGNLVYSNSKMSVIGLNELTLSSNQLGDISGLYYLRLVTKEKSSAVKLILK